MSKEENSVRVISGKFRSRKIVFPNNSAIRPTGDRVKESLFNWLQVEVMGANCLDLFAGSGALGIESLSRGAKSVTFVEVDIKAVAALNKNLELLGSRNAIVYKDDALKWLEEYSSTERFDIVYLDPSFSESILTDCCALLENISILKNTCMIYIESGEELEKTNVPVNWKIKRSKKEGSVYFYLFRRLQI